MSYLLRGTVLASAMFFVIYCGTSLVVACAWRIMRARSDFRRASSLFILRLLPLLAALAYVSALFAPAFFYFEPRHAEEHVGVVGVVLAMSGVVIMLWGIGAGVRAVVQARSFAAASKNILARSSEPLLLVTGAIRPQIVVSPATSEILTPGEMHAALRHETAHIEARDNLKKLLLRCVRFPWLDDLDRKWMRTAEFEADDAAATDAGTALELASALVKIARCSGSTRIPHLALSLAPHRHSELEMRMVRLLNWKPQPQIKKLSLRTAMLLAAAIAAVYVPLAQQVHEVAELLTR